ncbi:DUF4864 domain-containing protein [Rhodovulum euryhalinum]|uniref:YD repeat-containing protein n=1 Tax=Rhodovulum euryhalinum TaxID=35805 RepID=A0A4R2K8R9_9RHOB|nr:DUF4864 domain-containing protein [Rhodovulum euryhalinum]TCO69034.1 YD repeat-containing protein [Rhodovulum euryhalinum]
MRDFSSVVLLAILLAGPVRADPAAEAVQGVISRQIEAFLADDFATAFDFASPGIKGIFGTPDRFGQMVRNGYPMVWRPGDLRYLEFDGEADARRQVVEITDRAGRVHRLEYSMILTGEGWRIDGVRILPAPPPMA